jgi:hypothetical protein
VRKQKQTEKNKVNSSANSYLFVFCLPTFLVSPKFVQKLHVVPTSGIFDPMTVRHVAQAVVANSAQAPTPFTSFIHQSTCCGMNRCAKGLLADQTFSDSQGIARWMFQEVKPCCRAPRLVSFTPDKKEIGQLEYGSPTCGMNCKTLLCACCCRTATLPEWAWLTAVDGAKEPRLTFRTPAQEGECLLCKCKCFSCRQQNTGCFDFCSVPPDYPFTESLNLQGPLSSPAILGRVDIKGSYGWDRKCCGLCCTFGLRPELTTEFSMNVPLTFGDNVLAMQMGLTIADKAQSVFIATCDMIRCRIVSFTC